MTSRKFAPSLPQTFLLYAAMATAATALGATPQRFLARSAQAQQANTRTDSAKTERQLTEAAERQGPFSIGDQPYTVVLHEKVLRENGRSATSGGTPVATVVGLEILDAHGNTVFQETFPYALADGRFSQTLMASASLLSGAGGTMLMIRFIEQVSAAPWAEGAPAKESWEAFGVVKGQLARFGAVLPLGQGADITVGGVVTGVMVKGGIAVIPLASTAEELVFPVWTGNFYVFAPVRVDWAHGQWGEGEQCYKLASGTLLEKGCSMSVEAYRERRAGGGDAAFVRLFKDTDENIYDSQGVVVRADSKVDFLQALAIVHWESRSGRVECNFDNLWLRTRVDGMEGWVHGEEAFEALGLPRGNPR